MVVLLNESSSSNNKTISLRKDEGFLPIILNSRKFPGSTLI